VCVCVEFRGFGCFVSFRCNCKCLSFLVAGKSAAKKSTAASSVVQERLGIYITDRRWF
jgi:hypothetical protein